MGIMILALATRHRVERPAISMGGGTFSYGAACPPPSVLYLNLHSEPYDPHYR